MDEIQVDIQDQKGTIVFYANKKDDNECYEIKGRIYERRRVVSGYIVGPVQQQLSSIGLQLDCEGEANDIPMRIYRKGLVKVVWSGLPCDTMTRTYYLSFLKELDKFMLYFDDEKVYGSYEDVVGGFIEFLDYTHKLWIDARKKNILGENNND